jgi:hypothetical protein
MVNICNYKHREGERQSFFALPINKIFKNLIVSGKNISRNIIIFFINREMCFVFQKKISYSLKQRKIYELLFFTK